MRILAAAVVFVITASPLLFAQWPTFAPPNAPKLADGSVNMAGPPPRTADGKVDLSGVWETTQGRRGGGPAPIAAEGTGALPPSGSIFGNVGGQIPGGAPYQPWAAELVKTRRADNDKDNPDAHCLPMGFMQLHEHVQPRKIVQAPKEMIIMYEGNYGLREIFMDGRPLPANDPQPWWFGYSSGQWMGDTLVVETTGFRDGGWLDVNGSPLTDRARTIERYRRTSYGTMDVEVTVDDPKAYTRPWTVTIRQRLMPDEELIEFVCLENEQSSRHFR